MPFISDECIFDFFTCLHFLVPPSSFGKKKELNNNMWRFSIKNSQEYTLKHYLTYSEYEASSNNLELKNNEYKVPTQVRICAIGESIDKSLFYVTYDNIRYSFENLLGAFESALQIYLLFKIHYQKQSAHFWNLLQQYFYNIEKPCVKNSKDIEIAELVKTLKTK